MVIGSRNDHNIKATTWTDDNGDPIMEPLITPATPSK